MDNNNEDTYRTNQLHKYLDYRSDMDRNNDLQDRDDLIRALVALIANVVQEQAAGNDESALIYMYGEIGELPAYMQKEITKLSGNGMLKLAKRFREYWSKTAKE